VGFFDRLKGKGRGTAGREGGAPAGGGRASDARAGQEPPRIRLRSLALASLFSHLVPGGAYDFLDLGPAIGSNIEFLSHYVRTVRIGDLHATLNAATPRDIGKALESLTPEGTYHGILAWDLFNYLDEEELHAAARILSRALTPGGYLLAVIHYTAQMPGEPLRFRIADRETVTYREPRTTRPAPRYPQRTLEQAFEALELEHSYLLKAGLQEYLFIRE
jgi:hypothetical protein